MSGLIVRVRVCVCACVSVYLCVCVCVCVFARVYIHACMMVACAVKAAHYLLQREVENTLCEEVCPSRKRALVSHNLTQVGEQSKHEFACTTIRDETAFFLVRFDEQMRTHFCARCLKVAHSRHVHWHAPSR